MHEVASPPVQDGLIDSFHVTTDLDFTNYTQVDTDPLSVTSPVDYKAYSDVSIEQVIGKHPVASSLNHSVRVLLAG